MEHTVDEKYFIDFTSKKLTIVDRDTGELEELELFDCILGGTAGITM